MRCTYPKARMSNRFGCTFAVSTFGESHGPVVGCVVDGCPPGVRMADVRIQAELDRRKPGSSQYVTQRAESDIAVIMSGVFRGATTGSPIALVVRSTDQRSADYRGIRHVFRPGHADYASHAKYFHSDYRGGGRSSARLTAPVVAAGAIAKAYLACSHSARVRSCMLRVGTRRARYAHWCYVRSNPFSCCDARTSGTAALCMRRALQHGSSVGATVQVWMEGLPAGLGDPLYAKLSSCLAHGLMSVNAVKAVRIGLTGMETCGYRGDMLTQRGFLSNRTGGIAGGLSTGQDIVAAIAMKPTPSSCNYRRSTSRAGLPVFMRTRGRHDPCVGMRAPPVLEAIAALCGAGASLKSRATLSGLRIPSQHPASYLY
ncbi:Chorismate synthase [Candidatus Tremblaya princeps]|uniref:Chorismate synthase n=1 Tax=Tremblaya princeps TaxID=189385 RepID=A0A143WP98_TREPR|nr:Chorismate synthase [Candidatus Tremblaya princeps]